MAIFEGVCEWVFGSTFALQSYPEYLEFFRRCAVPWVPDFKGCWPCLQVSL